MKILFTLPLLLLSINSLPQVPIDGLIAYWPFNRNANDESGNGNNGTVYGARLTTDRCNRIDSAYYFDGIDDYIEIGTLPELTENYNSYSLSFWIKSGSDVLFWTSVIRSVNNAAFGMTLGLDFHRDGLGFLLGRLSFDTRSNDNKMFSFAVYTPEIFNNQWHYIVYNLEDISNNKASVYIDGESKNIIDRTTEGPTDYTQFENPFALGAGNARGIIEKFYKGSLDDFRIYNRTLNEEEILSLYHTTCSLGSIHGESEVCQGQNNVSFYMQPVFNATSYTWNYSGNGASIIGSVDNVLIDFASDATSGNLSVTVRGNNINTQSISIPIVVNAVPLAVGVISGDNEVCTGQNGVTYFVPVIDNATSYLWNYSGTGTSIIGNSNNISVNFANNATSGNLTVAGYNGCGIGTISEDFSIEVNTCNSNPDLINIPNSFSPNADGINDFFLIRGLTENSKLMIFNRFGEKLYESTNYQNDWDGKDNDGNALESDTYWYVIYISGIPSEFKGFVYLKR